MAALSSFVIALLFSASIQQPSSAYIAPYQFLDIIIKNLGRIHGVVKSVNEKAGDPSLVERMTAIQNGQIELDIAKRSIQSFALGEGTRQDAAQGSIAAYDLMRKSLAMQLALYEKLDAAKSVDDLAGMRREISDAKVMYQQASAILVDATVLAVGSAVVADAKDPANHVALDMTKEEKTQLIKSLESGFSAAIRAKPNADEDTGPMQAAKVLLKTLEQDWRYAK